MKDLIRLLQLKASKADLMEHHCITRQSSGVWLSIYERKVCGGDALMTNLAMQEKRKRETGQAKKGPNYVEDEKRQLRKHNIYSGFDN